MLSICQKPIVIRAGQRTGLFQILFHLGVARWCDLAVAGQTHSALGQTHAAAVLTLRAASGLQSHFAGGQAQNEISVNDCHFASSVPPLCGLFSASTSSCKFGTQGLPT